MYHKKQERQTHEIATLDGDGKSRFPALVARNGGKCQKRFATFFTDNVRNANTRQAYFRATTNFFDWCERGNLEIEIIESFHVSAYIEELMAQRSVSTVKQHLAAIRMLFDWLVVGQIVGVNPAHAVRGPRHVVSEGTTPILDKDQMQSLLSSIDTDNVVGLRDRALIALMTATFGRIQASLNMNVCDYYDDGKNWSIKLNEKNGKTIVMPVQHKLEEYLDSYIASFNCSETKIISKQPVPLFRSARGRSCQLTSRRMSRQDAWRMIKRRTATAGISQRITSHSFRGTGITNYLENGGSLLDAQRMAGHSDPRTTRLYDRRNQRITRGEVERITILG